MGRILPGKLLMAHTKPRPSCPPIARDASIVSTAVAER